MTATAQRKAKQAEQEVNRVNEQIAEQQQTLEIKGQELTTSAADIKTREDTIEQLKEELKAKEADL